MSVDFRPYLSSIARMELKLPAGKNVFEIDTEVEALFIVKSGVVHLVRENKDGEQIVLQRANQGDMLSETPVFSERYHCTAMVMMPAAITAYPIGPVRKLITENVETARAYMQYMALQFQQLRQKRHDTLSPDTIEERLDAWLKWNDGELPHEDMWPHVADEIRVSKEALKSELIKRREQKE